MPLYIQSGSSTPADANGDNVPRCRSLLLSARDCLFKALAADPNAMLEAKSWLAATLAAAPDPPAAARTACLLPRPSRQPDPAATATGLNAAAQRQLLQLLAEHKPADVWRHLHAHRPQLLLDFFEASDTRIRSWFAHFDMAGISAFQYGAKALANYALAERDHAWQHLVWTGKHAQAPVAVAAKPHYFCELDAVRTVRHLLRDCPGFWRSEELARSCEGGAHLALDYAFFVEELTHMLEKGRSSEREPLLALLHSLVVHADWRPMCERLLPFMGEAELLRVASSLGQRQQQPQQGQQQQQQQHKQRGASSLAAWAASGSSATARDLAPLLLSGVVWDSAKDVVLANALGCHRALLGKLLQEQGREAGEHGEEGAQQLPTLLGIVGQLHGRRGCDEAAHQGVLASLGDIASPRRRMLLLLECWTLRLHLQQAAASDPNSLEELLQQLGAQYERQQAGIPGAAVNRAEYLPRGDTAGPSQTAYGGRADLIDSRTSSDRDGWHCSRSSKRKRKQLSSEKRPGSKRKKKSSHRKHRKRRRHSTPHSDSSSGGSLLDVDDFPSHVADEGRQYVLRSSEDEGTAGADKGAVADHAAAQEGHSLHTQTQSATAGAGAAAGSGSKHAAQSLTWSVKLPGWDDRVGGSTMDVVDAVSCYGCQRWVQQLLAQTTDASSGRH